MLSEHEFTVAIRDEIYPMARKIEARCLELFNAQNPAGRGPTAVIGMNETEWAISLLNSSVSLLESLATEKGFIKPGPNSR